jgi:RNA polymerase sigma factor (sigma-70 family)
MDEAALDRAMDALADGDRSVFDALFRALYPRAFALARKRLKDESLAADAAQETMTKMFARAVEFHRGAHVLPWFYAICANEVRAIARRRGAVVAGVDSTTREEATRKEATRDDASDASSASNASNAEDEMLRRELARALDLAIASLDEDGAEAIAAMLGDAARPDVADATFRKRLSRAYAKVRHFLRRLDAL